MYHLRSKRLLATFCLSLVFISSLGQQKISGVVITEGNQPLNGATVNLKNSALTTITGSDGSFTLEAKKGDILEISFIGYKTQQIKLADESAIKVSLQLAMNSLDEVVVTGYTSQRIKEITGSVSMVKPRDLVSIPAGQVEQMLQGRAAGLTVITSGEPGAPTTIRLHGLGNFGELTPLYIIDGTPGDINSINPYDIESLQVLKDAAAYSVYGVRGANGVIIVTTKRGRPGKTRITYEGYVGWQQPLKKGFDMLSPQENAEMIWQKKINSKEFGPNGNPEHPLYGNGPVPVLPDYLFAGPYEGLHSGDPRAADSLYSLDPAHFYQIVTFNKIGTDWFHEMYKPAFSQNHTLSASGGNEKSQYFFSLGYLDQEGTMINTYLKRFSARINTEFNYGNKFRIGENLQLSYTDNPQSNKYGSAYPNDADQAILTDPSWPVYDIRGAWNPGAKSGVGPDDNPVGRRVLSKNNKQKVWEAFGNVFAALDFLKYFTAKTSVGGSLTNFYSYAFDYAAYDYPNAGFPNALVETSGYLSSLTWTTTLSFSRTISEHSLKALVGTELVNNNNRQMGGSASNFPYSDPNYWLLNNGAPSTSTNYTIAGITNLSSFISQIDYAFKDRYFFRATLRNDGSSVFGPQNRFGWFPAISAAWRLTEENFLRKTSWLTELKLRLSWGKTGFYGNTDPANQFTLYGGNPYDAYYDINGNSTGNIQRGYRTVRLGNPRTGWQEDEVFNTGIDGIFWNGKMTIMVDGYVKRTKGLLFPVTLPALLGDFLLPNVNVGNIRNAGIDLTIGSKGRFSKKWHWDIQATFSHYDNKIIKLNDVPYFFDALGTVKNEVGHPIGSFFGYQIIGFFEDDNDVLKSPKQPAAKPGRFKYADTNGRDTVTGQLTGIPDGKINEADRVHFGNPHPDFTLGLQIAFSYENFDFSTFFYSSVGNDVLNLTRTGLEIIPNVGDRTALYDSWTPNHKNAKAPILETAYNFSNASAIHSYPLEDGSYIRNKYLMLGYTFPRKLLDSKKIEKLRIYAQVVNLFTITGYSGLDPELSRSSGFDSRNTAVMPSVFGIDVGNYPNNQMQFLVGINLGL